MLHIQTHARALYPVTGGIMARGANIESLGWVWGGSVAVLGGTVWG